MYESYLPLSTLFFIKYFKHLNQNWLSADTHKLHTKGIFGEFILEKGEIQYLNTKLSFFLWNEVKDIWCTRKLLVSFCLDFLNLCTQLALLWFQYFKQKCCVYWIFYLTSWILAVVSIFNNCLLSIACIGIGGVEPLGFENILRR